MVKRDAASSQFIDIVAANLDLLLQRHVGTVVMST